MLGQLKAHTLLTTHCSSWSSLNPPDRHRWAADPSRDQVVCVIYAAAYLCTFMEMCFLLSVCTREKPKLGDSSEGHGTSRACLGPAARAPGDQ